MFNNFFPPENRAVYEITEKYDRSKTATDDNIIRRMRFACCITKATDTHSECVIVIAFPGQQWLRECASMIRLNTHRIVYKILHGTQGETKPHFYKTIKFDSIYTTRQLSRYNAYATERTTKESCFDSRWGEKILVFPRVQTGSAPSLIVLRPKPQDMKDYNTLDNFMYRDSSVCEVLLRDGGAQFDSQRRSFAHAATTSTPQAYSDNHPPRKMLPNYTRCMCDVEQRPWMQLNASMTLLLAIADSTVAGSSSLTSKKCRNSGCVCGRQHNASYSWFFLSCSASVYG
jgi:hypothetical protein